MTIKLDVPEHVEGALNPKVRVVERNVKTSPADDDFMNALKASVSTRFNSSISLLTRIQFAAGWVQFRTNCFQNAGSVCLPHAFDDCVGLLPDRTEFTPQYRANLKKLLKDRAWGLGLLHQTPSFGDGPPSEVSTNGFILINKLIILLVFLVRKYPVEERRPRRSVQPTLPRVVWISARCQIRGQRQAVLGAAFLSGVDGSARSGHRMGKTKHHLSVSFTDLSLRS